VGSLFVDARIDPVTTDGFTARLSRDWEIWGPNGGYMAAIALRAAHQVGGRARPANATVHFLGVASFDMPVEVSVVVQRDTRQATSTYVRIEQTGKSILAAMVWAIDDELDGLAHDDAVAPDVEPWHRLPTMAERAAAAGDVTPSRYRFWDNFEQRPPTWMGAAEWAAREPAPASYLNWLRFMEPSPAEPWLRAEQLLLLVDLGGWPAIGRRHVGDGWMAPSIDVSCEFHRLDTDEEWMLLQGASAFAGDGLIATHQHVWDEHGRLLASGRSHLLSRRVAPAPAPSAGR
jgi:acyl-CoA thioesterase